MTVQNYIGINLNDSVIQTEIEFTSEVEVAIYDRVEEIIRDVFSGESTGTTPETSGVDASNYYTKKEIEELLKDIFSGESTGITPESSGIDASNYYTKAETDAAIDKKVNSVIVLLRDIFSNDSTGVTPETSGVDTSNYYTKEQTEARMNEIVEYFKNKYK